MLESLQLQNFRKHQSTSIAFEQGLTVFRAPNEAGKSTIAEAIAYALFGARALRTSLDDAVTWGNPVSTLKVTLKFSQDGVRYTVTRAKSGCECLYADQSVTGQTEVTNFLCKVLKVDAAAANKLMLAPQTEIRGALSAGPKATAELIEQLSEFNQIDDLIDLMQNKLTLGTTAAAEATVKSLQERLDQLMEVQQPDIAAMQQMVDLAKVTEESRAAALRVCKADADVKQQELTRALEQQASRSTLQQNHDRLSARVRQQQDNLQRLEATHVECPADAQEQIQSLMQERARATERAAVRKAYSDFVSIPAPTNRVKMSGPEVVAYMRELSEEIANRVADKHKTDIEVIKLNSLIHSGSCSFCGQDFSEVPEVKAKNAKISEQIMALDGRLTTLDSELSDLRSDLSQIAAIVEQGSAFTKAVERYRQYLEVDESCTPPKAKWVETISCEDNDPDYSAMIKHLQRQIQASAEHARSVQTAREHLDRTEKDLHAATVALSNLGAPADVQALRNAAAVALREAENASTAWWQAKSDVEAALRAVRQAEDAWQAALAERERVATSLYEAEDALKRLVFNNALLKRVRAARPLVADKLWNLVLSAVGNYFSEMRGEKSRVSKGAEGFTVDGTPVAALSGSTLDILGLAIRVALTRTFLPTAPFLILDEPAAGCDTTRTQSMLGFLTRVGFKQLLLVTHEDVSESVADHIVTLGAT